MCPEKEPFEKEISSMVVFASRKRGVGGIESPNWQYIPLIYIAFRWVICYLPPFMGTRNNHWYLLPTINFRGYVSFQVGKSLKSTNLYHSTLDSKVLRIHFFLLWHGDSKTTNRAAQPKKKINTFDNSKKSKVKTSEKFLNASKCDSLPHTPSVLYSCLPKCKWI